MKILAIAPSYPHPGHPYSGIFNERSVLALQRICDGVEVLAPRPYVLAWLASQVPRWSAYRQIPAFASRDGVDIHRPAVLQFAALGAAAEVGTFYRCRRVARQIHQRVGLDAIISFDLFGAGGLAWRIGCDLGIPASGWATGGDLNLATAPSARRALVQTLKYLQVVFYQSHELLDKAAALLGCPAARMPHGHFVLPRGIVEPPRMPRERIRTGLRAQWGIKPDQMIVLCSGRLLRQKGIFELLHAVRLTANQKPDLMFMLLGSQPAFDETTAVKRWLEENPLVNARVRIYPACSPEHVWEVLSAVDLFVLPSHREGMPNSLLEAMVMGVPAVAFGIPPVLEIDDGQDRIALAPPFDSCALAREILRLAVSPEERAEMAERGRKEVMRRFMARENMLLAVRQIAVAIEEHLPSKHHLRAYEGA